MCSGVFSGHAQHASVLLTGEIISPVSKWLASIFCPTRRSPLESNSRSFLAFLGYQIVYGCFGYIGL
jgi:hypothetical protein